MNKLALKISAGTLAAAASLLVFASSTFAAGGEVSCVIKQNGILSKNKCVYVSKTKTVTVQKNFAAVGNVLLVAAGTGDNKAVANTGDTTIDTGNAEVTITITNTLNQTNK